MKIYCNVKTFTLLLMTFFVVGCAPSLTKEQKEAIDSVLIGKIKGEIVNDKMIHLWNEVYQSQLVEAVKIWQNQYQKEYNKTSLQDNLLYNGGISEFQSIFGSTYHDKYENQINRLNQKAEKIENEFDDITTKMGNALSTEFYVTKQRIDDLYAVYKEGKCFSDLSEWIDNPEFELLKIPFIMSNHLYDSETDGIMVSDIKEINMQEVFLQCLSDKIQFIDCTPLYAYTMIYHYLVNLSFDIKRVYLVKVEESENSYIVGYSNMKAYLCTLMGEEENQSLAYEPIEFDQTLIGKGIE